MKVFAYCSLSFDKPTRRAAGATPFTSPPVTVASFDPRWLEGKRLLYFDLHGEMGEPVWRGDGTIALDVGTILEANLGGAVVFATSCYLAEEASPMLDAFLRSGASYVIGGDGLNWAPGSGRRLYGAHTLGLWVRRLVLAGFGAPRALAVAKKAIRFQMRRQKGAKGERIGSKKLLAASEDTLGFRIYKLKKRRG